MLGISDVVNKAIDRVAPDWVGDAAATAVAVSTGEWDEVAQHGADLLEDACERAGWEEGAVLAREITATIACNEEQLAAALSGLKA